MKKLYCDFCGRDIQSSDYTFGPFHLAITHRTMAGLTSVVSISLPGITEACSTCLDRKLHELDSVVDGWMREAEKCHKS